MPESAHLLLAEHDAIDPWWSPRRNSGGTATLVQQFSEATENLLRRTFEGAQNLRQAGYVLDAVYFILGCGDGARSDSRFAIARCLQSVLEPRTGILHLVAAAPHNHLIQFQLADHLREAGSTCHLEMHFPGNAYPGPTLSRDTPSRARPHQLLDVA